jgi:hypothetical protein
MIVRMGKMFESPVLSCLNVSLLYFWDKNTACHQHQNAANNEGDVTEEAITRFDQENYSADSDPESYLHSNSDLGEPKNAVSMPT